MQIKCKLLDLVLMCIYIYCSPLSASYY